MPTRNEELVERIKSGKGGGMARAELVMRCFYGILFCGFLITLGVMLLIGH